MYLASYFVILPLRTKSGYREFIKLAHYLANGGDKTVASCFEHSFFIGAHVDVEQVPHSGLKNTIRQKEACPT